MILYRGELRRLAVGSVRLRLVLRPGELRRLAVDSVRLRLALHWGELRWLAVGSIQLRLALYRDELRRLAVGIRMRLVLCRDNLGWFRCLAVVDAKRDDTIVSHVESVRK